MNKLKTLILSGVMLSGLLVATNINTVEAYTCLTPSTANPKITVSGQTATAMFTLPKGCKNINVTLVSYKAPNGTDGKPYSQQTLYKSVTRNYNIEGRREISVAIPDCYYQVDLVIGQPVSSFPNNEPIYHHEHRFLLAKQGGSKSCTTPTPNPKPTPSPSPTPTPTPPSPSPTPPASMTPPPAPPAVTYNNTYVTPAATPAPAPAPEPAADSGKLPNTGPGTVAAFSFGSTFMGSLLFAYRKRYTDIMDSILSRF